MKKLKIATIGGGSSYTPELIEGFIKRKEELNIGEIWLVDIEDGQEKLNIVGAMAKRMVKAAGLDWKIHLTLDREAALKDADFVSTQFRVGLLDARIKDERIPLKYGMLGQETNGAGGIFKALRTIPVIMQIIDDMRRLCPDAWLINFTNPSGMVTEAAIKHAGWEKTIGLCNVPIVHMNIANAYKGLPPFSNELYFKFAGLNHFHWHRVWDKEGNEITQEIIEKQYNTDGNAFANVEDVPEGVKNIPQIPIDYELLKHQGILPCMYHRYYYISETMYDLEKEEYEKNNVRAQLVKATEERLFELYKDENLDYKPEELNERGGAFYSDAACEVMASIVNDKRTLMVVSTANKGAIDDLPYDCVAEVSSYITAHGAEPLRWGKFDSAPRGMLQVQKAMEECAIKAALSGSYEALKEAFMINPLIESGDTMIAVMNELLVAHKKYLPQFKDVIKTLEADGVKYE
ncbi:6-phospho-beta-glucosidase [Breznakia sp. PF5-3]|uniref:6-phospho-beta-glucosidase n=1 Tax=unclassified Breznakia TaxID=2623764 RepID=UPI0024071963|nr:MULTISPECIES: 6-phospho-beta-glucosidase [unclassified Breznakia]MDF9823966.1 6-phospho-beta-glucosidase [Breznakia sp. PM6-1]MDF9834765.1 6-phospho-beta-glucosidase [Breznakia sp. PF5-3]MDF9838373.1 6-phospho-beta-glucosidase [Breznakia sp. PFB2-8]MDF9860389.1 6-phospho-beta-glucosidase [Breznakia sp. PH5-24]